LSSLKFLGFEQIFKNALTGREYTPLGPCYSTRTWSMLTRKTVNIGGGKGGADFDPKGKSDNEIRRFCQAFMRELSRHIGADTDVPAGDIGVSGREIGYMFGAYRQARNRWEGVLTGKGLDWGGSLIRPEATGYGLVYYVEHMLEVAGRGGFQGKRVAVSGSGNVAQYAALKVLELGGRVVSLSDSQGSLVVDGDEGSFTAEQVGAIAALKAERKSLTAWETPAGLRYIAGARPWTHVGKVDVALPSATQNEVSGDEARALVGAGVLVVAEGSNMGCTQEAIDVFEGERRAKGGQAVWYAPGKASNCGGVAVSGLEMAQNSQVCRPPTPHPYTCITQSLGLTLGRSASPGPSKRSTTSSRTLCATPSTTASTRPRTTSRPPRASCPAWWPAATLPASSRWHAPCTTRAIGGREKSRSRDCSSLL
jgi:glutamate dehydrogenase (NADP+)